ncbi:YehS family protein [Sporosarcina aquimarina]|uniref:DUF1456 family protein n=1 Tax=Sporosarcina aquimarina TaxID=114975 RepID=A0ABU4G6F5_9BACL|nr:DUF1456 family protein [Sporosarcina aquimarina]MDW0111217.1 DUF1456 family protein [Sporosarcina aquimarina]
MNANDILTRVRYALDIKDAEMVEIFQLGGMEVSKPDAQDMLTKSKNIADQDGQEEEYVKEIDNHTLESFLNGLVTLKRGTPDVKPENAPNPFLMTEDNRNVNNILLKKMKIALSLTSEDMLDILQEAGVTVSKSELSAVLRKEGHRNYKDCGDRYARNFLKGLALRFRA